MTTPVYTDEAMFARYKQLCAMRDKKYEEIGPLQLALDAANEAAEKARIIARDAGVALNAARGGENWLALKREIRLIASSGIVKRMGTAESKE